MNFFDAILKAAKAFAVGDRAPVVQQRINPDRNARRKFKRQVGARQARRQLCTSYQLRDAYSHYLAAHNQDFA